VNPEYGESTATDKSGRAIQTGQSDALHTVDGLESAFPDGYTCEQWQSIAQHLFEHAQNGLT